MLRRSYADALAHRMARFPIVAVLGPRQCGKTTFVRHALPDWTYVDLERPSHAEPLLADPEGRLRQLGDRVIFDEAQRVPALFPVLRSFVDEAPSRKGRYVLAGSAAPGLGREVSESLAGRTGFLDMAPLGWDEVARQKTRWSLDTRWLRGGFPAAYLARTDGDRTDWLEAYTRTFIERDLFALGIAVSAPQMRRLWAMLAHANGGLWNASRLASSMGVSYHTVNRYVDILEQAFLVRRLTPYFANVGKRLVKSPKVYLRDTGLLHFFLGMRTAEDLYVHPARGTSWESFVIDQFVTVCQRGRPDTQFHFWRTAQGDEVDLLIQRGRTLVPIEVKLTTTPGAADAAGILRCMELLRLPRGFVVYPGKEDYSLGRGVTALGAAGLLASPTRMLDL